MVRVSSEKLKGPPKTTKMESLAATVYGQKPLAIVAKLNILDAYGVPGYSSNLSEHGYQKAIDNSKAISFSVKEDDFWLLLPYINHHIICCLVLLEIIQCYSCSSHFFCSFVDLSNLQTSVKLSPINAIGISNSISLLLSQ